MKKTSHPNDLTNLIPKIKNTVFVAMSIGMALCLGACGGSGDSAPTASNGSTTFHVINSGPYAYAHVKIIGDDGSQIYASDFNCAANAACEFSATMNQTGRMFFYDDKHVITDGYTVAMVPASFVYVKKPPQMLGHYVQGELLKRYPESATALANKLEWFFFDFVIDFNSPDNLIGRDEVLGLYYQYRMVGSGLSVDEFYTDLHNSLESGARVNSSIYDSIKAELRARSQDLSTNLNIITGL